MRRRLPLLLTVFAVGLIAWGIAHGEVQEVWRKAVTICLSCVGIG